jgi:hypothetical protein
MRHGESGFVLALSMLVLVVLSGIGIFALRTSRVDLRATGNLRLGTQAEYVAEAALQQSVAQLMRNPALFMQYVSGGGGSYTFPYTPGMFGENASDPATYDAFGVGVGVVPNYSVVMSRAIDMSPSVLPGFMIGSVGGTTSRFRLKRVDVTANGQLSPALGVTADQRTSSAQVRAQLMIGPL